MQDGGRKQRDGAEIFASKKILSECWAMVNKPTLITQMHIFGKIINDQAIYT